MKGHLAVQDKKKGSVVPTSRFLQHTAIRPIADHTAHSEPAGALTGSGFGQDFSQVAVNAESDAARSELAPPCPVTPTRCPFGGACHACPVPVQAKLAVNRPGDWYEQEADRVAEQAVHAPEVHLQRRTGSRAEPTHVPPIVHEVLHSPGQPLDAATRVFMQSRFGHDFSRVRVHTDAKAAESARTIHAFAYTVGHDVVFASGQYAPKTTRGRRLLAHELMHSVQQGERYAASKDNAAIRRSGIWSASEQEAVKNSAYATEGLKVKVDVASGIQVARSEREHTYWFQDKPPEKRVETPFGMEIEPRKQVFVDPVERGFDVPGIGRVRVQFAGMSYDFRDYRPREEMKRGEELVLQAVKSAIEDLLTLPEVEAYAEAPTRKEARAKARAKARVKRVRERSVRARLKESFRVLTVRPLNVFIVTRLTVAEKTSLRPFTLRTQQVYVSPDDLGNPSKLQAAIRIPLLALVGGELGLRPGGERGLELTTVRALTPEESKEALLHEILHVFLINRKASANQLWTSIGANLVMGPANPKTVCETVMQWYLIAQEELFVFTNVGELYAKFGKLREHYENFIKEVDRFLASKSVKADQTKSVTLDVKERVAGKKLKKWTVSYKYPKSVSVSESDSGELQRLAELYPAN